MSTATSVIWTEQDEWKKQYKLVKYAPSEHNKPFTQVLRERNGCDYPDISTIMDQHSSVRGDYETLRVEAFCQGADQVLFGADPTLMRDHQLANIEEPRAWVSDRNYWLLKDDRKDVSLYGNVLSRLDLYKVLQNEVCAISFYNTG